MFNSELFAQFSISGRVVDKKTKEGITGVSVFIKDTFDGTITDYVGRYHLSDVQEYPIIVFQAIGMKTQEIILDTRTTLDVKMK